MLNYGMQDIKYAKDEERRKNEKKKCEIEIIEVLRQFENSYDYIKCIFIGFHNLNFKSWYFLKERLFDFKYICKCKIR